MSEKTLVAVSADKHPDTPRAGDQLAKARPKSEENLMKIERSLGLPQGSIMANLSGKDALSKDLDALSRMNEISRLYLDMTAKKQIECLELVRTLASR